ncbi:Imm63 family immunity protein [Thalassospira alkalitolerans]|uniref:Imm63 family immunity protein n=1 Tax=Thalassospira alkalitolerans TaxID=1293890 RepID=UPI003AA91EAE
METSLKEIQLLVFHLGDKIDASYASTIIFDSSPQNGRSHLEIKGDEFHYICKERGLIIYDNKTNNIDELLYWIFQNISFEMALDYEFKNRKKGQDSRKILFSKQLEILQKISEKWKLKRQEEINGILKFNPFK